jgi:hypothetical protein
MYNNHKGSASGGFTGEYMAPKHKSSTVRGTYFSDDSVGVGDGLSARKDMDSNYLNNVKYNVAANPASGNPRQVPKPYRSTSISEKGHNFNIC